MFDDGFNERTNYIHNSLDRNKIQSNGASNIDSSFAKMNIDSHKNDIETVNTDKVNVIPEVKGNRENFILRNQNIMNAQNIFRK